MCSSHIVLFVMTMIWTFCNDWNRNCGFYCLSWNIWLLSIKIGLSLASLIVDFFSSVQALLRKFNFRKEEWVLGNVCTKFGIFLKFYNFIRSEVFSSWTIREHQLLHLVPGNNIQVPFLLLWGETLSKVSKYFRTWCNSEVLWDTLWIVMIMQKL